MSDDRETDHTQDPREQGTGQGGYPESQQEGTSPKEGTKDGPEGGAGGKQDDAPSTSSSEDGDSQQATGNPDAAG